MLETIRERLIDRLRWSEKYFKTDMVYLARGGFWLLFGQIGSVVLSLGLAVLFGHFASQDTYGNYKYITSIAALLSAVSLSGLGTAVTRAAARDDEGSLAQGFWLNLRYSAAIILIGIIGAGYYLLNENLFAATGLALAAVALPFINGFSLYDSFLIGIRDFKREAIYLVASLAFTTACLGITMLLFSQRAIVLVGVYFFSNLVTDVLWYAVTSKRARNEKKDPDLLRYGAHLSVMNIISAVADKIDSIAVFTLLGPAQLAIYSYAIAMPEQIKGVIKNIAPLSMPKFAQRSISEIQQTIWNKVFLLVGIVVITIFAYIVFAPILFKYLFPVYIPSTGFSQIYALSLLFSFTAPFSSVFQAHKKTKELYIVTNVSSIFLIVTLSVLTYFYGIMGAIFSQLLYRGLNALLVVVLFKRMES